VGKILLGSKKGGGENQKQRQGIWWGKSVSGFVEGEKKVLSIKKVLIGGVRGLQKNTLVV